MIDVTCNHDYSPTDVGLEKRTKLIDREFRGTNQAAKRTDRELFVLWNR